MCSNSVNVEFTKLLNNELRVALGCTEPIAIAYAAAYATKLLGEVPERFEISCSANIIKNVMAVTIPSTNGLRGIKVAVLAGAIGGNPEKKLEVLEEMDASQVKLIEQLVKEDIVQIKLLESDHSLHIILKCFASDNEVSVEIIDAHDQLGDIYHNGKKVHERSINPRIVDNGKIESKLSLDNIIAYADSVNLQDIQKVLERQIQYNTAIAKEGLTGDWGARVGKNLNKMGTDLSRYIVAATAAADARMNGCPLPVVINSGSGNQGLTVSLPIIGYAERKQLPYEKLLRALTVGNLLAIHQKLKIGKLSAFCGVVCAAIGAFVGIAYLDGADYACMERIISNTLASISGMLCDGAKSSCASKIAAALTSAYYAYQMAKDGLVFGPGEGIVKADVETTILAVGHIAQVGMKETDQEILKVMLDVQ